eukprot:11262276-Alexandrium_andersonii.AAC.1
MQLPSVGRHTGAALTARLLSAESRAAWGCVPQAGCIEARPHAVARGCTAAHPEGLASRGSRGTSAGENHAV